jgi:hypothetical protein
VLADVRPLPPHPDRDPFAFQRLHQGADERPAALEPDPPRLRHSIQTPHADGDDDAGPSRRGFRLHEHLGGAVLGHATPPSTRCWSASAAPASQLIPARVAGLCRSLHPPVSEVRNRASSASDDDVTYRGTEQSYRFAGATRVHTGSRPLTVTPDRPVPSGCE